MFSERMRRSGAPSRRTEAASGSQDKVSNQDILALLGNSTCTTNSTALPIHPEKPKKFVSPELTLMNSQSSSVTVGSHDFSGLPEMNRNADNLPSTTPVIAKSNPLVNTSRPLHCAAPSRKPVTSSRGV